MPALEGNEFTRPKELQTTVRFGGKSVVAGDYALLTRTDTAAYGYVSNTNVNCYALGAAVYRITEGSIALVPVGHIDGNVRPDVATLQSQAAAVLTNYPKMAAPQVTAQLLGSIKFGTEKRGQFKSESCFPDATFTFTPLS
jgi:hypothetical protein